MKLIKSFVICSLMIGSLLAGELNIVTGSVGADVEFTKKLLKDYEKMYGQKVNVVAMPTSSSDQFSQYKLWLAAKNSDIDVYQTDIIWAPQIANHLVDLTPYVQDVINDHFPSIVESQTVNGKLVAMPFFTDAPALYYRKDLLSKYSLNVPTTWEELTQTAKIVLEKENDPKLQGFVWQGNAYEGLTCDALEWIKSYNGGQIIEPNGDISINNKNAAKALDLAKTWPSTISPAGVLTYQEEQARGVWQTGNAVFMRNWPYAYSLGNSNDSNVKGKFDIAPLPKGGKNGKSAATLGGWNLAVSKYSKNRNDAIRLVKFLTDKKQQKLAALELTKLPTIKSLYTDKDIVTKAPMIPAWKDIFLNAVPRPSAPTKKAYNEVSKEFYTAVNNILSGNVSTKQGLSDLEKKLKRIKRNNW
ncbi:ABC transporter substrate-binding protein [Arcobacter sp.]|uniref:ABC transporter substrate-binding protein n=1 Tax=Arcobacter sp. TaxID=1872629 RepID=UPI003D135312